MLYLADNTESSIYFWLTSFSSLNDLPSAGGNAMSLVEVVCKLGLKVSKGQNPRIFCAKAFFTGFEALTRRSLSVWYLPYSCPHPVEVEKGLGDWGEGSSHSKALFVRTDKGLSKDLVNAWTLSSSRGHSACTKIKCSKVFQASGVLVWGLSLSKVTRSEGT